MKPITLATSLLPLLVAVGAHSLPGTPSCDTRSKSDANADACREWQAGTGSSRDSLGGRPTPKPPPVNHGNVQGCINKSIAKGMSAKDAKLHCTDV